MKLYKCGCYFEQDNKRWGCQQHPTWINGGRQPQPIDLIFTNEVPREKPGTHREMLVSDAARAIKAMHPDRADEIIRELDIERVLTALVIGEHHIKKIEAAEQRVAAANRMATEANADRQRIMNERDALQKKLNDLIPPAIQKPKVNKRKS